MEDLCAHCDIPERDYDPSGLITSHVQTALVTDANICIAAKGNVLEEALKMTDCKWM